MTSPYKMTVDLNVLDHLGINLYSNIAAVLTEAVANAWDADADVVRIKLSDDCIEITDDGVGMSVEEMNGRYLRVGYRRREEDPQYGRTTKKGRPVMGRKGLGKLSLFSIAETIEIQSAKDGVSHGLSMTIAGIKTAVDKHKSDYVPDPLDAKKVTVTIGTYIALYDIKRERLGRGIIALRKRLARRFSILGEKFNFQVFVNDAEVTAKERGDLEVTQLLWHFDNQEDLAELQSVCKDLKETTELPSRLDDWDPSWRVKGWIGTSALPGQLDSDEAGNLNGIVVFARGRLFQENILDQVNDGRLYTKYITGQIDAEFLDLDDHQDIATSDRQRVQEDDKRYQQLLAFLRSSLGKVESQWSEFRLKHGTKKIKEMHPNVTEWLDSLSVGHKKSAEKLLGKIVSMPMDNLDDQRLLLKHGIFAFERMRLRGSTEDFAQTFGNPVALLELLADRDSLEATLYRDIVKTRLEAINAFKGLTDANAKERVLQEWLFKHLWLLDASWDRATETPPVMESRLIAEGVIVNDLTEKEKLGRVDIAYRKYAGEHIIVELKRADRKVTLGELTAQGQLYVDKLKKILVAQGELTPSIEVIFVLGIKVDERETNRERFEKMMASISEGSRVVYYDELIASSQAAYSEYLSKSAESDRIANLVAGI